MTTYSGASSMDETVAHSFSSVAPTLMTSVAVMGVVLEPKSPPSVVRSSADHPPSSSSGISTKSFKSVLLLPKGVIYLLHTMILRISQ